MAVAVFLVGCAAIKGGLAGNEHFGDVSLYQADATRVVHGQIPYRDFFFEYPPGSLVAIVLPALVSTAHYATLFKALMAVLGAASIVVVGRIARDMGETRGRMTAVLAVIALSPFLLGPLVLDEYDQWPTLLTSLALLAFVRKRDGVGAGLLGFGAATKVFPAFILPAALVWVYRRSGRQAALRCLVAAIAVAAVTYVGFVALAPGGVWNSIEIQARRGLQKESVGSALLYVLDQLGLYKARIVVGNSQWTELTGTAGNALAVVSSVCQVAVAFAAAAIVARRRPDPRVLVYGAAVAVAGFVAFGKVFSPQYLIWLVPLAALAGGVATWALLAVALVLT
ncbi:MAG TPA: glycosyltransferase family 87 protein, partial [Gaiellaceae bacterium]